MLRNWLQMGGQKGDRVILVSENTFFWVATYLGVLKAGRVCVPLPSALSPDDLDYILEITERGLLSCSGALPVEEPPGLRLVFW